MASERITEREFWSDPKKWVDAAMQGDQVVVEYGGRATLVLGITGERLFSGFDVWWQRQGTDLHGGDDD